MKKLLPADKQNKKFCWEKEMEFEKLNDETQFLIRKKQRLDEEVAGE